MIIPRPKKSLGQNFLVDQGVLGRIVDAVAILPGDRILEVGPGRGALTRLLAEKAGAVVAVELDSQLVPILEREFQDNQAVRIVQSDILRVPIPELLGSAGVGNWKVAANLPYNISSQVLFKLLDERSCFNRLVLMLQREVGERILAPPDCKEYGILSVLLQMFFDVRREFIVRPGSFHPVPKVDSIVLSFLPLAEPRYHLDDESLFRRIVKGSFAHRRKTLWNCLRGATLELADEQLKKALDLASIDPVRRGETLSLEEFARLTNLLLAAGP